MRTLLATWDHLLNSFWMKFVETLNVSAFRILQLRFLSFRISYTATLKLDDKVQTLTVPRHTALYECNIHTFQCTYIFGAKYSHEIQHKMQLKMVENE